ncbi:MAG TPA: hypothetical protein VKG91_09195 [Roseiarcus sp.]|nr:hypothetical protein [Roseiarcus sp.]
MLKTIALIGLTAAIVAPPISAFAQTGYGVTPGSPSTSTFDRAWNHANQSKERARASAGYVRHHAGLGWYHHHHHYY